MAHSEDNQKNLPPWKRRADKTVDDTATESAQQDSNAGFDSAHMDRLSSSESELLELARANERASRGQVVENFENLFFHDDFFRLVGIGAVGGFAVSCILIVVVLEFTKREFAETFPDFWYLFPLLTIVGFVAWTVLLLKVRGYRRDKWMREIAFGDTDQVSKGSDAKDEPQSSGPRHSEADEEWL